MRPIDADALLKKLEGTYRYFHVKFDIEEAPTIEAEPVKHGKWRLVECGTQCTSCTRVFDHHFEISQQVCSKLKRCPECGAIMDLEE